MRALRRVAAVAGVCLGLAACAGDTDHVLLAGTVHVVGDLGTNDGAPVMLLFYQRTTPEDAGCSGVWLSCPAARTQALVRGGDPVRVSDDARDHDFALHAWRRTDDVREDVAAFLDVDGDGRPSPLEPIGDDPDNPAEGARETDCGAELGPCIPIDVIIPL